MSMKNVLRTGHEQAKVSSYLKVDELRGVLEQFDKTTPAMDDNDAGVNYGIDLAMTVVLGPNWHESLRSITSTS